MTDCIEKADASKEIHEVASITYCPIGDILADVFKKPLQGTLFESFSNSVFIINDAVLMHIDDKEDRIVLGITHMGVSRTVAVLPARITSPRPCAVHIKTGHVPH